MRPLSAGEIALARSVFGDAIDYQRVRIAISPTRRAALTLGSRIFFPKTAPCDFADASLNARAWFIHEMTHVLQFQDGRARTLWNWLKTAAGGGYVGQRGYRYRLPLGDWRAYNLEQQATMVEHAYVLREGGVCAAPDGADLDHYAKCVPFFPSPSGRRES